MARIFLFIIFIFIAAFAHTDAIAATGLQTTHRYTSSKQPRCLNIFIKSKKDAHSQPTNHLSEFKLRTQDFTPDGEWWFVAKEIQKHLDEAATLPDLIEKLKNLGEKSKKIRKENGIENFEDWDIFYHIFISVDYLHPLVKFKNEITAAQKDEILKYVSQILDLPLTRRKKTSFSAFYNNELNWEPRYTHLMMFEAFLSPRRIDDFLTYVLEAPGIAGGVGRGEDRSGWDYVNPSLITLLATIDATTASQFILKLRDFIEVNKALDKDESLDGFERRRASTLRRNGEVLLNLLLFPQTLQLLEALKTNTYSNSEVLERIDQLLEIKNGYKPEVDTATLRLIAKEISLALSELTLSGDTYIVGSAMSGRFKKRSSDIDLIFSHETQEFFKKSFKEGVHGLLLFNKPLSNSSRTASKVLLQMQKRVHGILKNRANENIFSSSGISVVFPQYTPEQQKDMILFGFSALSNNFSIRINNEKIYLGIYDPLTYTSYELDITDL